MWDLQLQTIRQHPMLIFAGGGSRSRQSRLRRFCRWQIEHHGSWYRPDLAAWRDQLLQVEGLTPATVRAYLSTVRSAYDQLLRSNQVRQWLYTHLAADMAPERKWVLVAEFTTQLKNAIDPANAPVKVVTIQDEEDTAHVWLTPSQVAALVQAPGLNTWKGLRDTALIALLLCTGIRAAEAAALEVGDLRATLGGALALKVRSGKGFKQRLVPYGAQEWGLALVEAWLDRVGLTQGPVFVGLRKGNNFYLDATGYPRWLSVRSIEVALASYAIPVNGQLRTVSPHDLRRTYARQLYLVGTDLVAIQQNLGHDRQETTLDYIGILDAEQRTPGDAYGTTWLQPLWEQLAQQESASQL